jgi:hypothetical protein
MNEFAKRLDVLPPRRLPACLARFLAGKYTVDFFTASTVTSNKKLREGSSWTPQ